MLEHVCFILVLVFSVQVQLCASFLFLCNMSLLVSKGLNVRVLQVDYGK